MTRIGASPLCALANSRAVWSAKPARVQSDGEPGTPASSSITGRCRSGLASQAGGSQTNASRAEKSETAPGIGDLHGEAVRGTTP